MKNPGKPDNNRMAAFSALLKIETEGAFSNIAVNEAEREYIPDDPAFVRNIVYGVTENRIYLDYRLSALIKTGLGRVKPRARVILLMGAYQIEFVNSVPEYAAVSTGVELAKQIIPGLKGFINGVLRAYAGGSRPALPEDPLKRMSVEYSYSEDIIKMWIEMFGEDKAEKLLKAGNERPPLTICVNTLKTTADELKVSLEAKGFGVSEPELPEGFEERLKGAALNITGSALTECDEFKRGLFYIQDISSMAAISELAPKKGDTVIDMCAAPGGKSFFAAGLMKNTGRIIACDVHAHRLKLLEKTSERLGTDIIETLESDGTVFNSELSEAADCVIVDAPCSGLGVVRRKPEIKLHTDIKAIKSMAKIQFKILSIGANYVKPGGRLIYSTCTISSYENEQIIKLFSKKNMDFFLLKQKQFVPYINNLDGFYFSVFQRF